MVDRLRADRVRCDHAVAQSGDQNRAGLRFSGQQLAQQRAERAAGAGKGVLLAADECVQLDGQVPAARLADLLCGAVGQDLHLAYRKALERPLGLPDLPDVGRFSHIFDRFDRKVGAERPFSPLLFGYFAAQRIFLCSFM